MATAAPVQPRKATLDDVPGVSMTLAAAFYDDPVFTWWMPDDARRRELLPPLFRVIAASHLPYGEVYTTEEAASAAVWVPPATETDDEGLVRHVEEVVGEAYLPALHTLVGLMAERHPGDPHYYLFLLGTRPQWQSRGLGSRLMREVLPACDRDAIPAYLEASSERNVALYLRHGFEVTGEIHIPDGPTMWCMWRNPR